MEKWDAYNIDETLAGTDLIRGEKIPAGLRHAVSETFVIHVDGTILVMQRDYNKPNYPGYFESGAGGAVLKGESFLEGAKRELQEETGIIGDDYKQIYKVVTEDTIYKGYVCYTNIPKDSITLQEGETIAYKWVSKEEFLTIYKSEQFVTSLRDRLADFVNNNFHVIYDCGIQKGNQWFRYRAAAIIIEDGDVLLARNDLDNYYYSIGGGVHIGETAEQAVVREVFEETGVQYEVNRLAYINESFFYGDGSLVGKECHVIELYFIMKPRGTKELNSNSYTQGVREHMHWLPVEKLREYKVFPLFFKDKLLHMSEDIEHFVTDERE